MVVDTGGPFVVLGGLPKVNPALREAQRERDAMLVAAREFGMTPSARSNVTARTNKTTTAQNVAKIVAGI